MAKALRGSAPFDLQHLVDDVRNHALYGYVTDDRSLRVLMRKHVFAVWDFQSLLKALQREMTCVDVPWSPTPDPEARRLVNEIVLDEESDQTPWGGHLSHFELYHRAMIECGADTGPIDAFTRALTAGKSIDQALEVANVSVGVMAFVQTTIGIAMSRDTVRIAAAFSLGREDIVPQMFEQLVKGLADVDPRRWSTFRYYLERHIERDTDKHAPAARELVARLCGPETSRRVDAEAAARACLEARVALWDDVLFEIRGGG
jgi:hypothetical protein